MPESSSIHLLGVIHEGSGYCGDAVRTFLHDAIQRSLMALSLGGLGRTRLGAAMQRRSHVQKRRRRTGRLAGQQRRHRGGMACRLRAEVNGMGGELTQLRVLRCSQASGVQQTSRQAPGGQAGRQHGGQHPPAARPLQAHPPATAMQPCSPLCRLSPAPAAPPAPAPRSPAPPPPAAAPLAPPLRAGSRSQRAHHQSRRRGINPG